MHPSRTTALPPRSSQSAFTLVELSVVLLIIALLTGGIVAGVNIKRSAELKIVPDEIAQLRQAVSTFRDRYEGLPGDIYNATKFWSAQDPTPATCIAAKSTGTATCNGDGNGMVTTYGTGTTYYEALRFWQHLSNAGLFTGHYDGDRSTSNIYPTCRVMDHCGKSRYRNGMLYAATVGRNATYFRSSTVVQDLYTGDKGNAILLFGPPSSTAGVSSAVAVVGAAIGSPFITSSDAQSLDAKFDDGKPSTGFIQTFQNVGGSSHLANSCASSATAYNIGSSTAACALLFTNAF